MPQVPLTIREQLEAWRDAQSSNTRAQALDNVGLAELYRLILGEGERSTKCQHSLSSPRTQAKLIAIGIDVETTWVALAKHTADPTKDWFPHVRIRRDVVELFRPFYKAAGGEVQLSRMFFGERELHSIFVQGEHLPGLELLNLMLQFCVNDQREGGARKRWNKFSLFFLEGQWNVFGRGNMPLSELTGEEEFNEWFCQHVPHEQVDHVANELNKALGADTFSPHLLIAWRKGSIPSKEKYEALLRGIQKAFPQWLESTPNVVAVAPVPAPKAVPKPPQTTLHAQIPLSDILRELADSLPPSMEEQEARRTLDGALVAKAQALRELAARLEAATVVSPEARITATRTEDPGEVVDGFRFVLTADSFQSHGIFTLAEAEDTEALLTELTRRLAMINSMDPQAKRAVMARLRHAWDQLFIQVRLMDVADGDLPAMFQEMRLVAGQLGGRGLTET